MKKINKKYITVGKIVISISLVAILISCSDINEMLTALREFQMIWLIPVFGCILLSTIVSALKWKILLEAQNLKITLYKLFRYYICGLFFNNFLPSSIGGDGVRIYLAGKESNCFAGVTASVVLERVIATVTLSLLGIVSALFAKDPSLLAVVLMVIVFFVGAMLVGIQLTGWVPKAIRKSNKKIAKSWISFAESSNEIGNQPKKIMICILESFVFQIMVALVIGSIMGGLRLNVPPLADLFLITSASSVLAMIPIGLNGYGMREGSYAYLLAPFSYSSSQAITVSILFGVFVTIFSALGGVIWLSEKGNTSERRSL